MTERIDKFDELRGLAIIGVIAIHTASHDIGLVENEIQYWLLVALTMLGRFAVPCFLIISGFFISHKEKQNSVTIMQSILLSRCSRIIPPYFFWSSLYFILFVLTGVEYSRAPIQIYFEQLLTGTISSQLYFIVLIAQMYLLSGIVNLV